MKKYTPEYLYSIWLAIHLHFNDQKFDLLKYSRVNRQPNNRILARLRQVADRVPAKQCRNFIIANYIEAYRETGDGGSGWLYNKSFPDMRECHDRYFAHMANIEHVVYEDIVRLLMIHRNVDFLLDFEKKELHEEFLNFEPPSDQQNRWDWLGFLHGQGDVPLMLELFFTKRFSMETLLYIMDQSNGSFWAYWQQQFGSNHSFPNYQNDFLFLYKYNRLLQWESI